MARAGCSASRCRSCRGRSIDSPQGPGRDLAIGVAGDVEVRTMRQLITSGSSFENDIGYSRAVVDGEWVFIFSGTPGSTTPP